jgi:hypothetical protein
MVNTVWIVSKGYAYEGTNILDVFDTKEKALQFANAQLLLQKNENENKKWGMCMNTTDMVQWDNESNYLSCEKYEVK